MTKLIFTIERASEHTGEIAEDERADYQAAQYRVELNNGDTHWLKTAAELRELIDGELFLNGFQDREGD